MRWGPLRGRVRKRYRNADIRPPPTPKRPEVVACLASVPARRRVPDPLVTATTGGGLTWCVRLRSGSADPRPARDAQDAARDRQPSDARDHLCRARPRRRGPEATRAPCARRTRPSTGCFDALRVPPAAWSWHPTVRPRTLIGQGACTARRHVRHQVRARRRSVSPFFGALRAPRVAMSSTSLSGFALGYRAA